MLTRSKRQTDLDFELKVSKHHVEVIMSHPQLVTEGHDEFMINEVVILQTSHWFILLCKNIKHFTA